MIVFRGAIKANYRVSHSCRRSCDTICIVNYFYHYERIGAYLSDACAVMCASGAYMNVWRTDA